MKALTLWDPWATLVALGEKGYETRSWGTSYRGPLAIHVAAKTPRKEFDAAIARPAIVEVLKRVPTLQVVLFVAQGGAYPGRVIALVDLVDVQEMGPLPERLPAGVEVDGRERAFGVWKPGRFAWRLENVRRLKKPVKARGGQRLWTPRAELALEIEEAARG